MANWKIFVFFVLFAVFNRYDAIQIFYGSVYCIRGSCRFAENVLDKRGATAYAVFNDTLLENGWGVLDIKSGYGTNLVKNDDIMYAAGFLEGYLTQRRINSHYENMYDWLSHNVRDTDRIQKFLEEQERYMRYMVKTHSPSNRKWRHVGYVLRQFDGLVDGYRASTSVASPRQILDKFAFLSLNANGDLMDISRATIPETNPNWSKLSAEELMTFVVPRSRCSALIKVLPGFEDVLLGHSTWFTYQSTTRIFKHYDFNVRDIHTAARQLSFSSYPGALVSIDDFYLLGSKMAMLQTTNNVYDNDLFKLVKSSSLLSWQRVRLANMMAHNGKEWADAVRFQQSGTYTNQYMVLDLKKIDLKRTIHDGALWVVEEIPGMVKSGDVTQILRAGYWASYNIPFFPEIYNRSHYPQTEKRAGPGASYQLCPRAKIFRREEGNVNCLESMKSMLRYNDYKQDPYSDNDPWSTICSRGDLRLFGMPDGCYDTKVASYYMALGMTADVISGPTTSNGLPPFSWNTSGEQFSTRAHHGLPEVYDFPFIRTGPRTTWN